jgi:hypothetical protein
MIVVLLGMHKSGTTLVAETLHDSGIHMAEVPDELSYDESNKYERHEAQRINRRLLRPVLVPTRQGFALRDAGLDRAGYERNVDSLAWVRRRPLATLVDRASTEPVMEMVRDLDDEHEHWGFKDPRTCLTYGWWQRALPTHRVVAVYRPFDEVMLRYRARWWSPIRTLRVARSWMIHNELLAEHLEARSDFVLLRYDELMGDDAEFERLCSYVGLDLVDRRKPEMYRARMGDAENAPTAIWMPAMLRRRVRRIEARLDGIRAS